MNKKASYYFFIFLMVLVTYYCFQKLLNSTTIEGLVDSSLLMVTYFLILAVSVFYVAKNRRTKLERNVKYMFFLMLYTYFVSIYFSFQTPFPTKSYYISLLNPALILLSTYYVTLKIQVPSKQISAFIAMFVFLSVMYFFYANMRMQVTNLGEHQNQTAYFVLYLFPIVMCHKSKAVRYALLALVYIVMIASAKRAGTVGLFIGTILFFYLNAINTNSSRKKSSNIVILIFLLLIVFVVINYLFDSSNLFIVERFSDKNDVSTEERLLLCQSTINLITSSDPISLLFGHGMEAVMAYNIFEKPAHNDLLEITYDFGLIAGIAYVILHVKLIKLIIEMVRNKSSYAAPFGMSYSIFFINSMISHIYIFPYFLILFCITWGYMIAAYKIEQQERYFASVNSKQQLAAA